MSLGFQNGSQFKLRDFKSELLYAVCGAYLLSFNLARTTEISKLPKLSGLDEK